MLSGANSHSLPPGSRDSILKSGLVKGELNPVCSVGSHVLYVPWGEPTHFSAGPKMGNPRSAPSSLTLPSEWAKLSLLLQETQATGCTEPFYSPPPATPISAQQAPADKPGGSQGPGPGIREEGSLNSAARPTPVPTGRAGPRAAQKAGWHWVQGVSQSPWPYGCSLTRAKVRVH